MPSVSDAKFLGKRIVLGVSGSMAAYKAVGLLRALFWVFRRLSPHPHPCPREGEGSGERMV